MHFQSTSQIYILHLIFIIIFIFSRNFGPFMHADSDFRQGTFLVDISIIMTYRQHECHLLWWYITALSSISSIFSLLWKSRALTSGVNLSRRSSLYECPLEMKASNYEYLGVKVARWRPNWWLRYSQYRIYFSLYLSWFSEQY